MTDTALTRIGGMLLLAAVATNVVAFAIGTSRGLLPPPAFDFASAPDLLRLSADAERHWLPLVLSLLSPMLAVAAGPGIFNLLKPAGWVTTFGIAMFFVGMVFVLLLDALELIAITRLAPSFAAAPDFARPSIQATGALIDGSIEVLGYVGHFFSFGLAQLAFGVAIIRVPNISNWLGWISFVPAIMIGWLAPLVAAIGLPSGALIGLGLLAFVVWLVGIAFVMLRADLRHPGTPGTSGTPGT